MTAQNNLSKIFPVLLPGLLLLLTLASCKKEAALTPTEDNRLYKLPQGNQPYDQQIMKFYNDYKTVILYKFSYADFNYTFTGPIDVAAKANAAGPDNVQQALDFIHQHWLDLYSSAFLSKALPLKILLANDLSVPDRSYGSNGKDTLHPAAIAGFNQITFGWVNKIPGLTPAQVDSARGGLNGEFLALAIKNGVIDFPEEFAALTKYNEAAPGTARNLGIFIYYQGMTVYQDLKDYLKVITTTDYATLNSTVFTPVNDPRGKYRAKYNALIAYFQQKHGIDLQAIGNR